MYRFKAHLDLAHYYWRSILQKGDFVIDATCGNGYDTLFLAQSILDESKGTLYALDIQNEAIKSAQALVAKELPASYCERIHFFCQSHATFPDEIFALSVKLVVYNLGYLPKGDKSITTLHDSTLQSIEKAMELVLPGGAISIMCYPGHAEGKVEQKILLDFISTLPPDLWICSHHSWINRKDSPSLIWMQKQPLKR